MVCHDILMTQNIYEALNTHQRSNRIRHKNSSNYIMLSSYIKIHQIKHIMQSSYTIV